jgi:peptidoglycan/LPS O-acetylase OafA/YrhL
VVLTVLAIAVNAAALAVVGLMPSEWGYLAQGSVLCRLAELTLGIAAAELAVNGHAARGYRGPWTVALGCLALVMAASPLLDILDGWTAWPAIVVLGAVFAGGALFDSRLSSVSVKARWLAAVAALSYCFYLTHAPVSKYTGRALANMGIEKTLVALPLVLAVCVLVACLFDLISRRWVTPRVAALFGRWFTRAAGGTTRLGDRIEQ